MLTPLAVPIFILLLSLTVPSFPILPIFMLFLSRTVWADREATDRKAISVVSKNALIFLSDFNV